MADLDAKLAELDPLAGSTPADASSPAAWDAYRLLQTRMTDVIATAGRTPPDRHRRPLVLAALAAALTIAVALPAVLVGLRSTGSGRTTGAEPTTSVPRPPVSHRPWPQQVLARNLDIDPNTAVAVPGTSYVLGLAPQGCMEPCGGPIVRLDVSTGRVLVGPVVPPYAGFDVAAGQALLLEATRYSEVSGPAGGWAMRTVDPATLRLGPAVPVTLGSGGLSYTQPIAPGSPDVWFDTGSGVALVDTTTGRIVRQTSISGGVADLVLAPDGDHLYAICGLRDASSGDTADVCELDPGTGRLLREVPQADRDNSLELVPTDTMVWAVDLLGGIRVYRAADLTPADLGGALPPLPLPEQYPYGFTPTLVGDVLVVQSAGGTTCVDPASGALRAEAVYPSPSTAPAQSPLDAMAARLLFLEPVAGSRDSDLVEVTPPAACFG